MKIIPNKRVHSFVELYYCLSPESFKLDRKILNYLSYEEINRAENFIKHNDKTTYLSAHAFLKKKLADILNISPQEIILNKNKHGKPYIKQNIYFNLSHSHNCWCIAVCNINEIGVDIEMIQYQTNYEDIIEYYFTKNEQNKINNEKNSIEEFYKLWTRKEALQKAIGKGLWSNINQSDVCRNEVQAETLDLNNKLSRYYLSSIYLGQHYISVVTSFRSKINIYEIDNINLNSFFAD